MINKKYISGNVSEELLNKVIPLLSNIKFILPNGVSDIPERFYSMACQLAEQIEFSFKEEDDEISFTAKGAYICNKSFYALSSQIANKTLDGRGWIFTYANINKKTEINVMNLCWYRTHKEASDEDKKKYCCVHDYCINRLAAYIAFQKLIKNEKVLQKERTLYKKNRIVADSNPTFIYSPAKWSPLIYSNQIHISKNKIMKTLDFIGTNTLWLYHNKDSHGNTISSFRYDSSYRDRECIGFRIYQKEIAPYHDEYEINGYTRSDQCLRFSPCSSSECQNKEFCEIKLASYVDMLIQDGSLEEYVKLQEQWEKELKEQTKAFIKTVPGIKNIIQSGSINNFTYTLVTGNSRQTVKNIVNVIANNLLLKETVSPRIAKRTMMEMAEDLIKSYSTKTVYGTDTYGNIPFNQVFVLTGIDEFIDVINNKKDDYRKAHHLAKLLSRMYQHTYIILAGEKRSVDKLFELYPSIKYSFKDNHLDLKDMSSEEIYAYFKKILPKNIELNHSFKDTFLKYIALNRGRLPFDNEELATYLAKYVTDNAKHELPNEFQVSSISVDEELSSLIGLTSLKQSIKELRDYKTACRLLQEKGIAIESSNNHMMFYGNPGTGKTSVIIIDDIPTIRELLKTEFNSDKMVYPDEITDSELRVIAIHELGHAVVRYALSGDTNITTISIEQEADGTLGYVGYKNKKRYIHNEEDYLTDIACLLSGKNAEKVIIGKHSSGCRNDIEKARHLASTMVQNYAMGNYLSPTAVNDLLKKAEKLSTKCINDNKDKITTLTDVLLEKKTISGEEIETIFNNYSCSKNA